MRTACRVSPKYRECLGSKRGDQDQSQAAKFVFLENSSFIWIKNVVLSKIPILRQDRARIAAAMALAAAAPVPTEVAMVGATGFATSPTA
jgi:hypothetical protein